ncbi:MAG: hypothetical protein ACREJ4_16910, partial [Candidatus Methylomirabilaceae bacterium]
MLPTPPATLRIRWKAEVAGTGVPANFEVTLSDTGQITFRYGTLPPTGTARVGVTPGNKIDFVAVAGYDRTTVSSGAQNVRLAPAGEFTEASYAYNALDQFTASGAVGAVGYNSDGDQTSITGPAPRATVNLGFDGRHLATSQTAAGTATT